MAQVASELISITNNEKLADSRYIKDLGLGDKKQSDINKDSLSGGVYNVTKLHPRQNGYYTLSTAIAAVPQALQGVGMVITYQTALDSWETKQFKGVLSDFTDSTKWEDFGGGEAGDGVYDISAAYPNASPFATLQDALTAFTDTTKQKGGMTIKFLNGVGDYEQWLLTASDFTTDESKWIKVNSINELNEEIFGTEAQNKVIAELKDYSFKNVTPLKWILDGTTSCYMIPIQEGDEIEIKKGVEIGFYTLLKSIPENRPTSTSSPPILCADGYDGLFQVKSAIVTINVPADAKYLYIANYYNSKNTFPSSLKINNIALVKDTNTNNLIVPVEGTPSLEQRLKAYVDEEIENISDPGSGSDTPVTPTTGNEVSVTIPTTGVETLTASIKNDISNVSGMSYYHTTAQAVVTINVNNTTYPIKFSMLCKVDEPVDIILGTTHAATFNLYNNITFYLSNQHWEYKEFVLPIPFFKENIKLTFPAGVCFKNASAEVMHTPNVNYSGGMLLHAHQGTQFGRNTLTSFSTAAKYGFSHCIANVRATLDGVLVCAHDDAYFEKNTFLNTVKTELSNAETKNISEQQYDSIEENGYLEASASTYNNKFWRMLGDYHLCTVDEFLAICARTHMVPEFSIHNNTIVGENLNELLSKIYEYGFFEKEFWIKDSEYSKLSTIFNLIKNNLLYSQYADNVWYVLNTSAYGKTQIDGIVTTLSSLKAKHKIVEYQLNSTKNGDTPWLPAKADVDSYRNLTRTENAGTENELTVSNSIGISVFDYGYPLSTKFYKDCIERGIHHVTTDYMISVGVNY